MINDSGYAEFSTWEHSLRIKDLYARRCRLEEQEMTCAGQAAELLVPYIRPGDCLLDAGCGSGYFYHSLRKRSCPVEYYGIDAAPSLIEIGKEILPSYGLDPKRLRTLRIEDMSGEVDHTVCLNVISNIDNYHRPLERILKCTRKTVILRESLGGKAKYTYVLDNFLDPGIKLKVHVNTYPLKELISFIKSYGYSVKSFQDARTKGKPEMVIGHPHYWKFLVAQRKS